MAFYVDPAGTTPFVPMGKPEYAAALRSASKPASFYNRLGSSLKSYRTSAAHAQGMKTMKNWTSGWMGKAFVGLAAYEGYKEGGAWGAVKGGASSYGTAYASGIAWHAAKAYVATPAFYAAGFAALGAAASYGAYRAFGGTNARLFRPWVKDHMKKNAELEMGAPITDDFGTVATMRQRSLQAIQNSRINGRTALGNEAGLMYSPYFR